MRSYWMFSMVLLGACHHAARVAPSVAPDTDAKQFLADAQATFRDGHFARALVAFRRLQFELGPGDPLTAEARYYAAECSFQMGDLATAALAFQKVAEEFPTSEYAALALLRDGDANRRLWRRPDVDATAGQTALATYQELLGRYPGTDAAARAQVRIRQLNEWFAEKGYRTGMFYLRRRAYDSAIIYFKDIVASYPDTRLVPDALLRLVDTYRVIGYAEERKETCANLRRYYPQAAGLDSRCPAETSAGAP
jgi:outer membrane protein assembly factor BamD